jgi:hypothetical protein
MRIINGVKVLLQWLMLFARFVIYLKYNNKLFDIFLLNPYCPGADNKKQYAHDDK